MRDMDETVVTTPLVAFEACTEYRSVHHEAECEACGWLEIDHAVDHVEVVFAEVLSVTPRVAMPLRRAS